MRIKRFLKLLWVGLEPYVVTALVLLITVLLSILTVIIMENTIIGKLGFVGIFIVIFILGQLWDVGSFVIKSWKSSK